MIFIVTCFVRFRFDFEQPSVSERWNPKKSEYWKYPKIWVSILFKSLFYWIISNFIEFHWNIVRVDVLLECTIFRRNGIGTIVLRKVI